MGRRVKFRILILLCLGLTLAACAHLLGFRKAGPRPFAHRAHLLVGISCMKCHSGIERAGDGAELHLPTTKDCVSCHQDPHDARECSTCHGLPFTTSSALEAKEHLRFSHESHVSRVKGNCVRCHPDAAQNGSVLRPPMATCFGCHAHDDQFRVRDCAGCHTDLPREMTLPESHVVHDGDFVREHGVRASASSDLCATCHNQRFCAACHGQTVAALPAKILFDQVRQVGLHRAGFRPRHAEEARAQAGLCSTCHSPDSCQSCHKGLGVSATAANARSPHPPGWLGAPGQSNEHGRAAWRNPAECASCHGGAGEAMCVDCHRVGGVGGTPHPPGWSSRRSKSELPCLLCHGGAR